ncbi:MAG: LamG domain-containing protein [Bacteroidota bacterium]|nr:LamG domain-containing protein [Bacteroidota bacterium]
MKILIASFLFSLSLGSQNMVPNGDFEDFNDIPVTSGEWYKCESWTNLSMEHDWPFGTPDYLSTQGEAKAQLPDCVFGHVAPHSGNAVMGFCNSYKEVEPEFREYVSNRLIMPMVVGNSYTVSFWVTNGEADWRSCYGTDHFGVLFSDSLPMQVEHEAIGWIPQYEYPGELWTTGWKHITFTFVADKPYEYITFGNFYSDAETSSTLYGDDPSQYGSYYFIDDVEIYSRAAF